MRRTEHLGARALTAVGLVATFAYLVWRVGFSMHDTELWLSLPALGVELVGFLGACALAWALWPVPSRGRTVSPRTGVTPQVRADGVDAIVRVDDQADHEVRATLLALRGVRGVQGVVLVDLSGRPSVAALATEFQALYAATDPADHNGVRVMIATARTPQFVLVDAGDIPTVDLVDHLLSHLHDPRVAVVQGLGVSLADDSAEHGPDGRHELVFERASLNPSLGRRGCAVWSGTGSLVRVDALRDATIGNDPALEAQWSIGSDLQAAGWAIIAPGDVPVVAQRPVHAELAVGKDRTQRARAARRMVFGARGALRCRTLSPAQRMAALAWAVRPLSGVRRVVFLVLLGAAVLAGEVPFHASASVLVFGWLPAFLYTSLGIALLSGWTLRPGDRTRWSLHSVGAACRSLRPAGSVRGRAGGRAPIVALPSPQYGAGLVVAVVSLSAILVLRGISDRLTHTLGTMPQSSLMVLLIVAIWTLAISLDLLRVLARRRQMRRTARVVSSLSATLGERAVSIVDLTAFGAGLVSQTGADVNERMMLDSVIPTRSGVTTMRIACIVRNVTALPGGDYRIGVEFGDTSADTANALAEFCIIEPAWERLGSVPSSIAADTQQLVYVEEPEGEPSSGRVAVRLVSLLALVGAVASSAPTVVDASPLLEHRLAGVVVAAVDPENAGDAPGDSSPVDTAITIDTAITVAGDVSGAPDGVETTLELNMTPPPTTGAPEVATDAPVPGAWVVGVCSLDAGPDDAWGSADDTYGPPVAAITDADGNYQLDLVGEACWATIAPPDQYQAASDGGLQVVDVSDGAPARRSLVLRPEAQPAPKAATAGSIGDTVWSDNDGNGMQDAGEPGVPEVLLTLLDEQGRAVDHLVSDASGEFQFTEVPAGTYRVAAANLPAGFAFTTALRGADPMTDSDADPITGRSAPLVLVAGETLRGLDVGLVARSAASASAPASDAAGAVTQLLPAPRESEVAVPATRRSSLSVVVLALAALLAISILLGLARPRRAQVR